MQTFIRGGSRGLCAWVLGLGQLVGCADGDVGVTADPSGTPPDPIDTSSGADAGTGGTDASSSSSMSASSSGDDAPSPGDCVPLDQLEVITDAVTAAPAAIRGDDLRDAAADCDDPDAAPLRGDPGEVAPRLLERLGPLLGLEPGVDGFEVASITTDAAGRVHVRATQVHLPTGLDVLGAAMTVHADGDGRVFEVDGRFRPALAAVAVAPSIDVDQAAVVARGHVEALGMIPTTELAPGLSRVPIDPPTLMIFARDGLAALAFAVIVEADGGAHRLRVFVDARSGAVLDADELVHADWPGLPAGSGQAATITGNRMFEEGGGSVQVTGWRHDQTGQHFLYDEARQTAVHANVLEVFPVRSQPTAMWGDADPHGISVAANLATMTRYFETEHGYRFGQGAFERGPPAGLTAMIADQDYFAGFALWLGEGFVVFGPAGNTTHRMGVLDILTHEYAHAIIHYHADLVYQRESGALNESFADIFAAAVELSSQPDGDWTLGEDASRQPGLVFRDMADPGGAHNQIRQPSRYLGTWWYPTDVAADAGGVHVNSGVQNHFFHLLVTGGAGINDGIAYDLQGIGVADAARIAWLVLTQHAQPDDTYPVMRERWISAAAQIDPTLVFAVANAWDAVGVPEDGCGLWFRDIDGDGFGDPDDALEQCGQPPGYVRGSHDCNDANGDTHLFAPETCFDGELSDCGDCGPLDQRIVGSNMELAWARDCVLEWTTTLGDDAVWTAHEDPLVTVEPCGRVATVSLLDGPSKFFRLRAP